VPRIVIENVHLDFPIYGTQHLSLRHAIYQRATGGTIFHDDRHSGRVLVKALNGITMELREGDRVGLIGHNGAGKSTLLKAIAGIYEPVQGKILVEGRTTPLFDMMPGLDLEDTGYENIITCGLLLGMSRDDLETKVPQIEEFSELGEYLSLPVRTYSAGMMARLGFALVTAIDPDVLLMDEGFGAADLRFAERSAKRMNEFIGRSRIMMLASHSDSMITSICNKAAWLNQGQLIELGPVDEILQKYHDSVRDEAGKGDKKLMVPGGRGASEGEEKSEANNVAECDGSSIGSLNLEDRRRRTTGDVVLTSLMPIDETGQRRWKYQPGETISFKAEYEVINRVPGLALLFRLCLPEDVPIGRPLQVIAEVREILGADQLDSGTTGKIVVKFPQLKLLPGAFSLYVCLGNPGYTRFFDVVDVNVNLPRIVISPSESSYVGAGVVALDYEIAKTTRLSNVPLVAISDC
jgi:ABC-type polysaccharide/polyol phosphate transport system ATPase subunit